jgi:hypothetical protein
MYMHVKNDDIDVDGLDDRVHFYCAGVRNWLVRNIWTRS